MKLFEIVSGVIDASMKMLHLAVRPLLILCTVLFLSSGVAAIAWLGLPPDGDNPRAFDTYAPWHSCSPPEGFLAGHRWPTPSHFGRCRSALLQ